MGLIMSKRFIFLLAISLAITVSASAYAQVQGAALELKQLQSALAVINAELKADFDQILLLQEAIKANSRTSLEAQGRSPDAVMLDDVAAAQRRAIQRETAINARLDAILARTAELDARKQVLLERVMELSLTRQSPATKSEGSQK